MRGKDLTLARDLGRFGITPAYAGKSANLFGVTTDYLGSPPPMRGKASRVAADTMIDGITPAYAGKRWRRE